MKEKKNLTKIQKVQRKTQKIQKLSKMVKKLENPEKSQKISKIHFFSKKNFEIFFRGYPERDTRTNGNPCV